MRSPFAATSRSTVENRGAGRCRVETVFFEPQRTIARDRRNAGLRWTHGPSAGDDSNRAARRIPGDLCGVAGLHLLLHAAAGRVSGTERSDPIPAGARPGAAVCDPESSAVRIDLRA